MNYENITRSYYNNQINDLNGYINSARAGAPWNEEYQEEAIMLLKFFMKIFKNITDKDVQENIFDYMGEIVANFSGKDIEECVDEIVVLIENSELTDWELANLLLVISWTFDEKYKEFMCRYQEYDDEYVKDVVNEYLYDLKIYEEKREEKNQW